MIDEKKTLEQFGYTSDSLSYSSHKKVIVICDNCGKERIVVFRTCSSLCMSCASSGNKHSEKTKQKISKTHIGIKFSKKHKQRISESKRGKKLSEEYKQKIRDNHAHLFGKNHPNWNPNITEKERQQGRFSFKYKKWRTAIYKKDNYICQICKNKGGILNAHHLEGYAENKDLRIVLSNGITLCEDCHKNFHNQYGWKNNTKEQYIKFKGNYNDINEGE